MQIEGLDAMMHDLNNQLNTVPPSELVGRSASMCGMLQEVQQRPTSDLNRTPVPTDFISEVSFQLAQDQAFGRVRFLVNGPV